MDIELHERCFASVLEAVDLASLDHEDVASARFELLTVDDPGPMAVLNELNFVVWMAMRSRSRARQSAEQKRRHVHIAVVGADEVV